MTHHDASIQPAPGLASTPVGDATPIAPTPPPWRREGRWRVSWGKAWLDPRIPTALVFVVALCTTYAFWRHEARATERALDSDFAFRVRDLATLIEQRIATYEQTLRGAQALFAASTNVTRDEFHNYVATLDLGKHYPGIQGVGFARRVPLAGVEAHVAEVRAEGLPQYAIHPSGAREMLAPIVFLEPFTGRNLRAFGYDMYSEPLRRAAMMRARDTGRSAISGKVRLVQETDTDIQAGFVMYLPVYGRGASPANVAERREHLVGWVYAPFRFDNFIAGLSGERGFELDMEVFDGDTISEESRLTSAASTSAAREAPQARQSAIRRIDIAGHAWQLKVSATPAHAARVSSHISPVIAGTGIALSIVLAALTWQLATARARADARAAAMNDDLRRSEARLTLALEAVDEGVWDWDLPNNIAHLSPKYYEITGYRPGEIVPDFEFFKRLVHPDDLAQALSAMEAHMQGVTRESVFDARMITRSGEVKWVLWKGRVVERDELGAPRRMAGVITDISARKRIEEALQENEERFRLAFEHAPTGMAMSSIDGVALEANPALCRMFGYSAAAFRGIRFSRLSPAEDVEAERPMLENLLKREIASYALEMRAIRKDGHIISVRKTNSLVADAHDRPVKLITQYEDVTDLKRAQSDDLARSVLAAQEAERAHLSHELHDEVGQSLTALKLLLMRATRDCCDPDLPVQIDSAQAIIERLMGDVRGIAHRLRPSELDELGLAATIRSHLDKLVHPDDLVVSLHENIGETRLPARIELCCFRVVQEALTNCIRHAQATRAEIGLRLTGDQFVQTVRDDGTGFDLTPFYHASGSAPALGLVGMRERVTAAGGHFHIESRAGWGTEIVATFIID